MAEGCVRLVSLTYQAGATQAVPSASAGPQVTPSTASTWRSDRTVDNLIERFSTFGRVPSAERYLAMFDPKGEALHPGMSPPAAGEALAAFIDGALTRMPNFRLEPLRCPSAATTSSSRLCRAERGPLRRSAGWRSTA